MDVLRIYITILLSTLGVIAVVHSHSEDKRLLLDNEPTVDLGGEVSRLQAQLLDQQKLVSAIQTELQLQRNMSTVLTNDVQREKNTTAEKLKQQDVRFQQDIVGLNKDIAGLNKDIAGLKQENKQLLTFQNGSGSVYVRWGRNVCSSTASVVYTGFTAGKHYNTEGSGSDNLCLPSDPTWSKYVDGASSNRAYIYGTEIDTNNGDHIFNYPVNNQDIPCAVCRSTKPSTVMIPARKSCYGGWSLEYNGYLMAAFHGFHAYNHICVDENPEFLNHGSTNDNQHTLHLVEGKCGSLPCPPYVEGRELACVVCSK